MSRYPLLVLWCLATSHAFSSKQLLLSLHRRVPSFRRFSTPVETSHDTSIIPNDESTVVRVTSPTGQQITLVGTAHLSEKSNDQVHRIIETVQPNAVMVETDPSRLGRIGIPKMQDIQVARVVTVADIELPLPTTKSKPWFLQPMEWAKDAFIKAFTQVARALLTNMYNEMGNQMNAKGGGEFLRAIQCAENCTACDTVILGDRDSLVTIQRAAALALQSGDALGVLGRLDQVNKQEMDKLEQKVRCELQEKFGNDTVVEESQVAVAMMETLKEETEFRTRLFARLEQEVPEFTQALLKERDYLMSESILRELKRPDVKKVVGVVGIAHVPGIEKHLKDVFAGQPAPLIQERLSTQN